jgi:hypothetical protein
MAAGFLRAAVYRMALVGGAGFAKPAETLRRANVIAVE